MQQAAPVGLVPWVQVFRVGTTATPAGVKVMVAGTLNACSASLGESARAEPVTLEQARATSRITLADSLRRITPPLAAWSLPTSRHGSFERVSQPLCGCVNTSRCVTGRLL